MALRNKFKNARRHMTADERLKENREKFGTNKASTRTSDDELRKNKKAKMTVDAAVQFGEDEGSLRSHEAWLLEETKKKPLSNEKEIEARMELTAQRRLAGLAKMSVRKIKQHYPYLMNSCRFIKDLETIMKDKDIRAKVRAGIDRIANLARKQLLKCKEKTLRLLLETSDLDTERLQTRHMLTLAALEILVHNLREPAAMKCLFVQEGERVPITPCILYDGADLLYARNLSLHVDKELIFGVPNGEEEVLALMSSHWLLNIEYAPKAYNVLVAMEWLLLGQRSTLPRASVIKLLNIFKKATK